MALMGAKDAILSRVYNKNNIYIRRNRFLSLIYIFLYCVPLTSLASWDFSPNLTTSLLYIDNIRLTSTSPEADWLGEINPGFLLRSESLRSDLTINYQMQNIFYKENSEENDKYHNITANSSFALIEDLFYLDATGLYGQRNVSNEGAIGYGNYSVTDNRTDYSRYEISPNMNLALSENTILRLRYTSTASEYEENTIPDESSEIITMVMSNSERANDLFWTVRHREQMTDIDSREEYEFIINALEVRYQIRPTFAITGVIGHEKNDFRRSETLGDPEGSYWSAGFIYNPRVSTTIDISVGERFYGETYQANISHLSQNNAYTVSYLETLRTSSQAVSINELTDDTGNQLLLPEDISVITEEVFLRKRLTTRAVIIGKRTNMDMSLFGEERKYLESDLYSDLYGFTLGISRDLNRTVTANIDSMITHEKFTFGDREDTVNISSFAISKRYGSSVTGKILYRLTNRDSTEVFNEYQQNVFMLSLEAIF